jgi:hypothetical protein
MLHAMIGEPALRWAVTVLSARVSACTRTSLSHNMIDGRVGSLTCCT